MLLRFFSHLTLLLWFNDIFCIFSLHAQVAFLCSCCSWSNLYFMSSSFLGMISGLCLQRLNFFLLPSFINCFEKLIILFLPTINSLTFSSFLFPSFHLSFLSFFFLLFSFISSFLKSHSLSVWFMLHTIFFLMEGMTKWQYSLIPIFKSLSL